MINMGEYSLTNKTKTKQARLIRLPSIAKVNLNKLKLDFYVYDDYLFYGDYKYMLINKTYFTRKLNTLIQDKLGPLYSTHSFRTGMLTQMARKKIHPKIIQEHIGHSNASTTMRYIKPSSEDIYSSLDEVFS